MLNPEDTAPEFSLLDQDDQLQELSNYKGQVVLIYFYPKDDTPGCTKEACTIADMYKEFQKMGVKVLGVSADSVASHRAFADKYNLPFTLLSDPDRGMIKDYGADKNGRTSRISYLVSPDGIIVRTYPNVDPASHAVEILKDLGWQTS